MLGLNKVAIIAAVASIVLVGCSSNSSQEPQPVVTVTESVQAPEQPSVDDGVTNESVYIMGLRSVGNPILNSATDAELLEIGYVVCDILGQGYSTDDIIQYMAREMVKDGNSSETYAEAIGSIIGAAEVALCTGSNNY